MKTLSFLALIFMILLALNLVNASIDQLKITSSTGGNTTLDNFYVYASDNSLNNVSYQGDWYLNGEHLFYTHTYFTDSPPINNTEFYGTASTLNLGALTYDFSPDGRYYYMGGTMQSGRKKFLAQYDSVTNINRWINVSPIATAYAVPSIFVDPSDPNSVYFYSQKNTTYRVYEKFDINGNNIWTTEIANTGAFLGVGKDSLIINYISSPYVNQSLVLINKTDGQVLWNMNYTNNEANFTAINFPTEDEDGNIYVSYGFSYTPYNIGFIKLNSSLTEIIRSNIYNTTTSPNLAPTLYRAFYSNGYIYSGKFIYNSTSLVWNPITVKVDKDLNLIWATVSPNPKNSSGLRNNFKNGISYMNGREYNSIWDNQTSFNYTITKVDLDGDMLYYKKLLQYSGIPISPTADNNGDLLASQLFPFSTSPINLIRIKEGFTSTNKNPSLQLIETYNQQRYKNLQVGDVLMVCIKSTDRLYNNSLGNRVCANVSIISDSQVPLITVNPSSDSGTVYRDYIKYNITSNDFALKNQTVILKYSNGTIVSQAFVSGNDYECYQETANESNSCGGLGTGSYGGDLFFEWYDGNFSNDGNHSGILYINYSKPDGVLPTSEWVIDYTYNSTVNKNYNLSIPSTCWSAYSNKLSFKMDSTGSSGIEGKFSCYDGSSWYDLANVRFPYFVSNILNEEGMLWRFQFDDSFNLDGSFTGLDYGNYILYSTSSDYYGNIEISPNVSINIAHSLPVINIVSPVSATNYTVSDIDLLWSQQNSVWCAFATDLTSLDDSIFVPNQINVSLTFPDGDHYVYITCNNSDNVFVNSSIVYFSVNETIIPPVVTYDPIYSILQSVGGGLSAFIGIISFPIFYFILLIGIVGGIIYIVYLIANIIIQYVNTRNKK